jgi:glyoxylase-like metal-dependent hydrolase (beta-lactamase superfamily II)
MQSVNNICTTCGTQLSPDEAIPEFCPICADDRQYINPNGQSWTNSETLQASHSIKITKLNERLYSLKITPDFAITQRAFLILSEHGNILWDCIPLLTDEVVEFINSVGGLKAIAFSHPHYYSNMNEWADKFNCPIYVHIGDEPWVYYNDGSVHFWDGERLELWDEISIIHIGGHFPGSSVLRVPSETEGALFTGDTFIITPAKQHIAIMYSYPNRILLHRDEFAKAYQKAKDIRFDTMHSAFEHEDLILNAKEIFDTSMKRYIDSYGL